MGGRLDDTPFAVAACVGVSLEDRRATRAAGSDLPGKVFQALLDVAGQANDVLLGRQFSGNNSKDVCHTLLRSADVFSFPSQLRCELPGEPTAACCSDCTGIFIASLMF